MAWWTCELFVICLLEPRLGLHCPESGGTICFHRRASLPRTVSSRIFPLISGYRYMFIWGLSLETFKPLQGDELWFFKWKPLKRVPAKGMRSHVQLSKCFFNSLGWHSPRHQDKKVSEI